MELPILTLNTRKPSLFSSRQRSARSSLASPVQLAVGLSRLRMVSTRGVRPGTRDSVALRYVALR